MPATAISVFHRTADPADFGSWVAEMATAARAAPGHLDGQTGIFPSSEFDWALSVTFATEPDLHSWLDGAARAQLLDAGDARGLHRKSADLIMFDDRPPGTGISFFTHMVGAGRETSFIDAQARLVALSATFSGFEGVALLRPGKESDQWLSVLRFRTDEQLSAWMNSATRRSALPELRAQLTHNFSTITRSTPFGSILRVQDGSTRVTPQWKTAMLVLLVLYPTVMTLSRFLGPILDDLGAEPWLSMWLSQIVSVGLMTWFLMPVVTGWFRRWLDPVDGAGLRVSVIGAGVAAAVYAVTLTIFASVTWLQFWDYLD